MWIFFSTLKSVQVIFLFLYIGNEYFKNIIFIFLSFSSIPEENFVDNHPFFLQRSKIIEIFHLRSNLKYSILITYFMDREYGKTMQSRKKNVTFLNGSVNIAGC